MKIVCPVNDWSCPYYRIDDGICKMPMEGLDPAEECDDCAFLLDLDDYEEE